MAAVIIDVFLQRVDLHFSYFFYFTHEVVPCGQSNLQNYTFVWWSVAEN